MLQEKIMSTSLKNVLLISTTILIAWFSEVSHLGSEIIMPKEISEEDCWENISQALQAGDDLKAQEYLDTIHALRKKANLKTDWIIDTCTYLLKEKLKLKNVNPECTQKIAVLIIKKYRYEASFPKKIGKEQFENRILIKAKTDYYKNALARAWTLDGDTYVLKDDITPDDIKAVGDLLILAEYLEPGDRFIRSGEVTETQIKNLKLNYAILKLYVETISKGKLALDIHFDVIDTTLSKVNPESGTLAEGFSTLYPDFKGMVPYPAEKMYTTIPNNDIIAWHFPSTMDKGWLGMGGYWWQNIIPGLIDYSPRGFIYAFITNPLGNIMHEYLHTLEMACDIRFVDISEKERKEKFPKWHYTTPLPDIFDFAKWYLSDELPVRIRKENSTGTGYGWKVFSFTYRANTNLTREIFDFNVKISKEVTLENIQKAQEIYKRGVELRYQNKFTEAIVFFDQALTLNPYHFKALEFKGYCYAYTGDYAAADACFRKNLNIPSTEQYYYSFGNVFFEKSKYENALYYFKAGYDATGNPAYLKWIAETYTRMNRAEEAESYLERMPQLNPLDKKKWKIVFCDSEEKDGEDRSAKFAIDGNQNTFWHTKYKKRTEPFPHLIDIDLGRSCTLSGFSYLPMIYCWGGIKNYEIYTSNDGKFGTTLIRGTFTNDSIQKIVMFDKKVTCRFIRFRALTCFEEVGFANMAELELFGE